MLDLKSMQFKTLFCILTAVGVFFSGLTYGDNFSDASGNFIKTQYGTSRAQAEKILEETRAQLQDMIQRRGGSPQVILLTGDMVRNWKTAQQAFDAGNYSETIRICSVIQRFVY